MSSPGPPLADPPPIMTRPSASSADAASWGISPNEPGTAVHVPVGTCGTSACTAYPNSATTAAHTHTPAAYLFTKRICLFLRDRPPTTRRVALAHGAATRSP